MCIRFVRGDCLNNNKRNLVNALMDKENPYITSYKLKEYGLNTYDVKTLVDDGIIERVRRGLYRWVLVESTYNEIVEIVNIVPDGVICLFSALSFYELTTYIPKEYNVAISRKTRKPILPKYPSVKIIYFSEERFKKGVVEVEIEHKKVKIFDLEKTVCDTIFYRNKIGLDIVKEVMDRYIAKPERNIQKLVEYAEALRVYNILKTYLEVLI